MALTQEAQMAFRVVDSAGVKASLPLYALVDPTSTVAQLVTEVQTQTALLDAITGGQITETRLELIVALAGGIKSSPVAGSNVEKTGLFTFSNSSNPRAFGSDVPAILDSLISGGRIDLTNTNVMAWFNSLITSWTHGEYTNQQFAVLNALLSAAVTFRKRRRAESRVSYEPA